MPELALLAIDVPIGLTESGARECDVAARKLLGPVRASSVFSAPVRPALAAADYPAASQASFTAQRKKVSKQAWAIYPKIREIDDFLRARPDLGDRIYEVHPEVTFSAWAGRPLVEPKKTIDGFTIRRDLVAHHFGADAYETVRARYPHKDAANDDIIDAFAALWTAERILRGEAQSLPVSPPMDAMGLPMRIVY